MKKPLVLLLLLLPLFGTDAQSQKIKPFEYLSSVDVGRGEMIKAVAPSTDTVLIYVQHVGEKQSAAANFLVKKADSVVWCYPGRHPSEKHLFQNTTGLIFSVRQGDTITFTSQKGRKLMPRPIRVQMHVVR